GLRAYRGRSGDLHGQGRNRRGGRSGNLLQPPEQRANQAVPQPDPALRPAQACASAQKARWRVGGMSFFTSTATPPGGSVMRDPPQVLLATCAALASAAVMG